MPVWDCALSHMHEEVLEKRCWLFSDFRVVVFNRSAGNGVVCFYFVTTGGKNPTYTNGMQQITFSSNSE